MGVLAKLINVGLRRKWTGQFSEKHCSHLDQIRDVEPSSDVCDKCVEAGKTWPALRMCLTCGYVGCCEDSELQHAFNHYKETGHPLVKPYKVRWMDWIWCYEDNALLDPR